MIAPDVLRRISSRKSALTRGCVTGRGRQGRAGGQQDHLLAGKDELLASQDALIQAQREQLGNYADTVRLHADRAQAVRRLPR